MNNSKKKDMRSKILIIVSFCWFILVSCEDWLTVASDTEIANEQQFQDQQGFQDAVIGVYLQLTGASLYGQDLTWGYLELLAQNYELVASSSYKAYFEYDYEEASVAGTINSIWAAAYNTIANINNILKWETINGGCMNPAIDSLVKGEMLAVRALLHFDLVRMHGKGNLEKHPEYLDELSIPYSTEFKKETPPRYSYGKTLELIIADLYQAIAYLEMDPVCGQREESFYDKLYFGGFVSKEAKGRDDRMNYYATKALLARVLMWRGREEDKQEAYALAKDICKEKDNGLAFLMYDNYVGDPLWYKRDVDMYMEWLFAPRVDGLRSLIGNTFSAEKIISTTFYWSKASVWERFELPDLDVDYRFRSCLLAEGPALNNYSILKNRKATEEEMPTVRERTSVIRLPELYYIMAECCMTSSELYNREEAVELLNEIRTARSIPASKMLDANSLSDAEIINEISKEYRKEFVGEGVQFYYYKRLGIENISGDGELMTNLQYVIPLPKSEDNYLK